MLKIWPRIKAELVVEDSHVKLTRVFFRNPATAQEKPFYIFSQQKPPGSTILPITEHGEVIAIWEFFQAADEVICLLPSGGALSGEKPEEAAKRELAEETGYEAGELVYLGWIWREPRNVETRSHLFLALNCKKVGSGKIDSSEEIQVNLIPWANWQVMITDGEIHEPAAIVATHLAKRYLGS